MPNHVPLHARDLAFYNNAKFFRKTSRLFFSRAALLLSGLLSGDSKENSSLSPLRVSPTQRKVFRGRGLNLGLEVGDERCSLRDDERARDALLVQQDVVDSLVHAVALAYR